MLKLLRLLCERLDIVLHNEGKLTALEQMTAPSHLLRQLQDVKEEITQNPPASA